MAGEVQRAMKPGTVLFEVDIDVDGTCRIQHWVVRTVRGGKVTAIRKDQFTWVKRSLRNHDWGWADDIRSYDRRSWPIGAAPLGVFTTVLAAWKDAHKRQLEWWLEEPHLSKARRTIARKISELSAKKK